jgi:hypothetical protein
MSTPRSLRRRLRARSNRFLPDLRETDLWRPKRARRPCTVTLHRAIFAILAIKKYNIDIKREKSAIRVFG